MNQTFRRRYIERNALIALRARLWEEMRAGGNFARLMLRRQKLLAEYTQRELADFADAEREEAARLVLPQLQFYITDRCVFRCTECSAYIPHIYKLRQRPYYVEPDDFRKDIAALEHVVSKIWDFSLIGGEPLLHPQLGDLIKIALSNHYIDNVKIYTAGAIMPAGAVLAAMREYGRRICMRVSDYRGVDGLADRLQHANLQKVCEQHGVSFQRETVEWVRHGDFQPVLTPTESKRIFCKCRSQYCNQLYEGMLFACPKANAGYILGEFEAKGNALDLRQPENLRQRLISWLSRDGYPACRTCPGQDVIATALQGN